MEKDTYIFGDILRYTENEDNFCTLGIVAIASKINVTLQWNLTAVTNLTHVIMSKFGTA